MAGLLGDIYSASNTLKRKVNGLLSDPMGTVNQFVGQLGDDTNTNINNMLVGHGLFGNKSVLTTPQQAQAARAALADYGAQSGMAAATVWHGSPHKFDKFDAGKIGTGEGNQAYGHGLYLAESPDVAKGYAENLAMRDSGQTPAQIKAAIKNTMDTMQGPLRMQKLAGLRADLEMAKQTTRVGPQTYKVDLPDEHIAKMLDWDKPLSQQHPDVQAALQKGYVEQGADYPINSATPKTGREIYGDFRALAGGFESLDPRAASSYLQQQGIPGIRYLDEGSRATGGTSNFVVFPGNEGLLNIMERNGKPVNAMRGLLGK